MAPPFSDGEHSLYEEDKPRKGRNVRQKESTPLSAVLVARPQLINLIVDDKTRKKKEEEGKTKTAPNRYETPRKINKVTLEIPLVLECPEESNEGESSDGYSPLPIVKRSKNARLSLSCHVPSSKPNGRWTGSVHGTSTVHKSVGSTNGYVDLSYKVSSSMRVVGGMSIASKANARPLQAHIGAQYIESKQDTVQVTLRHQGNNGVALHCVAKEVRDPWVGTSSLFYNTRSHDWSILLNATSMTTHVLRLGVGVSRAAMLQAQRIVGLPLSTIQFSVDPKLTGNRRAPASVSYQPINGTWQGSLGFLTSKRVDPSKSAILSSWRIGIQQGKASKKANTKSLAPSNWSIVVSWQHGDFTLRIPLLLGTLAGMARPDSATDSLVQTATPYLILAIVGVANELLSHLFWGYYAQSTDTKSLSGNAIETMAKAKEDAAAQQRLMKRTADSRKESQEKRGGLVIESAMYHFGDVSWDVTTPLQFSVNPETSSLHLASGSKQNLLGFYPLADRSSADSSEKKKAEKQKQSSGIPWWQEYWTPTRNRRKRKAKVLKEPKPQLTVEYSYKGDDFEVTIEDDEALILPGKAELN